MPGRKRCVVVDASHSSDTGGAGIAVATMGGPALMADIVLAETSFLAEAEAVLLGADFLVEEDSQPGSTIVTDCMPVYRALQSPEATNLDPALGGLIRAVCAEHGFEIEWQKRRQVSSAHVPAYGTLRAWLAGRDASPTRCQP